jgi:hypothetical protein
MGKIDLDHLFAHVASVGAIVLALSDWIPRVAAAVGLLWYLLQIWETPAARYWFGRTPEKDAQALIDRAELVAERLVKTAMLARDLAEDTRSKLAPPPRHRPPVNETHS